MLKKVALVIGVVLATQSVFAKDLTNRLGVGVKSHDTLSLPQLAVVYNPTSEYAVTGALGIDTQKDESRFALDAGVRRIVFKEDHMNFFMGGNLGLVNFETVGNKQSGFELNAVFGGEFFFAGLDSLGFSFEGGAGVVSADDVRFKTLANFAVIFYF